MFFAAEDGRGFGISHATLSDSLNQDFHFGFSRRYYTPRESAVNDHLGVKGQRGPPCLVSREPDYGYALSVYKLSQAYLAHPYIAHPRFMVN
jgi:hypothetical protein